MHKMHSRFKKRFTALTDCRLVTDPWGLEIQVPVLRDNHPRWKAYQEANKGAKNLGSMLARVSLKALLGGSLQGVARDGFRQKKKMTKAQMKEAAKKQRSEMDVSPIISTAVDQMPEDQIEQLTRRDLNALKAGVAEVLMVDPAGELSWVGVLNEETGEPVQYSLEERLQFLGWEGVLLDVPEGLGSVDAGQSLVSIDDWRDMDPGGELAKHINAGRIPKVKFDGNPIDEDSGGPYWVDDDQEYGGQPVGDAITEWIISEAALTEDYHRRFVEKAGADLNVGPGGESATSAS